MLCHFLCSTYYSLYIIEVTKICIAKVTVSNIALNLVLNSYIFSSFYSKQMHMFSYTLDFIQYIFTNIVKLYLGCTDLANFHNTVEQQKSVKTTI